MADVVLADLLAGESIRLGRAAPDWEATVREVGEVLAASGACDSRYVESMIDREHSVSTFVGEGVAIPHGTLGGKDLVQRDALCFVQYPAGVDWHGDRVEVCIGIAAAGDGHLPILAQLAELLMEPERAEALRNAASVDDVIALLTPDPEDDE